MPPGTSWAKRRPIPPQDGSDQADPSAMAQVMRRSPPQLPSGTGPSLPAPGQPGPFPPMPQPSMRDQSLSDQQPPGYGQAGQAGTNIMELLKRLLSHG